MQGTPFVTSGTGSVLKDSTLEIHHPCAMILSYDSHLQSPDTSQPTALLDVLYHCFIWDVLLHVRLSQTDFGGHV